MTRYPNDRGLLARLRAEGFDFFTGVPDASLGHFLADAGELPEGQHVPATWEAEAVALAAGSALTGARACVYMPESGVGYALEPLVTLCRAWQVEPLLLVGRGSGGGGALLDTIGWASYRVIGEAADES